MAQNYQLVYHHAENMGIKGILANQKKGKITDDFFIDF